MDKGNCTPPEATEGARVLDNREPANSTTSSSEQKRQPKPKTLRPQSKRASLLRAFLRLGDRGMNCFEGALQHHDFVLRSSISDFRRSFGIEFLRKYETVPGHGGSKIDCCRYWLSSEGARRARELLGEDA